MEIRSPATTDWTDEELKRLRILARKGKSAAQAAKALGRRVGSIRRQAKQMQLLFYKERGQRDCLKPLGRVAKAEPEP